METKNFSDTYAFFRGSYVPLGQANINILNQTFMYGLGVFDSVRGYLSREGQAVYLFRLREHLERMFDSMKIMRLSCRYSVDEVCNIVLELVKRNAPETDIYIRPSIFAASNSIAPNLINVESDICILCVPVSDYVNTQSGLKVQVSSWRRLEDNAMPSRAKINGSYVNTALAKTDAHDAGFDDCIVLSENGQVAEGSAMNLFMVKNGRVITTPATENIVEGITRATIIELCDKEFGLKTIDRQIDRSELYTADELFLSGTLAQVASITSVDHRPIGDGKPGAVSTKVRDIYTRVCRGQISQYSKWLTPVYLRANVQQIALPVNILVGQNG
jgi:branched-chain amino acid aminotransferase